MRESQKGFQPNLVQTWDLGLTVSVIHIKTICSIAVRHQGHISCMPPVRVSADSSLMGSIESYGGVPVFVLHES